MAPLAVFQRFLCSIHDNAGGLTPLRTKTTALYSRSILVCHRFPVAD